MLGDVFVVVIFLFLGIGVYAKEQTEPPKQNKQLSSKQNEIPEDEEVLEDSPVEDDFGKEDEFEKEEIKDSPYGFAGFVRQLFHRTKTGTSQKILLSSYTRIRAGGSCTKDKFKIDYLQNVDGIFGNHADSDYYKLLWLPRTRNRSMSMEKVYDKNDYIARTDIHRLSFEYRLSSLNIKVGRQAVSWGQGRLLNPMNLITPINPYMMDVEDLQGADAINITKSINALDSVQVVIAPYKRLDNNDLTKLYYQDVNALARYKATFNNLDLGILGGHHFHSWVWGTEFTLTKWNASWRFAYLGRGEKKLSDYPYYRYPIPPQISHQAVVGASYAFYGKLRTTFEIFANSAHYSYDPALKRNYEDETLVSLNVISPDRYDSSYFRTTGRIITKNPVLLELLLGYDVTELLSTTFFLIGDPYGKSAFFGPFVTYNITDNITWTIAGQYFYLASKDTNPEFKGAQSSIFSYIKWYF